MATPRQQIQSRFLRVYQEVTRRISTVHNPQQVMDLVVRRLPELLHLDAATIRLLSDDRKQFVLGAAWGVSENYLARRTIDSSAVIERLMTGKPFTTSNLGQDCNHDSCDAILSEGVKSVMSLPIMYKGQVTGLLRLLSRSVRHFDNDEVEFSMSLAAQVGIAIANSKMFQEMESQVRFFRNLRELSTMVNATLDLESILKIIVETLPELLDVKGCTIRLLQPETNRLELVAASGLSREYLNRGPIQREDSIFKVLRGEPVIISDATTDPRVDYHRETVAEGICSILALPIMNRSEVIGVLRLLTTAPRNFSPAEIDFGMTVAAESGNAIQKARTYRKITLLFNQIEEQERFVHTIVDALEIQLLAIDRNRRIVLANRAYLNARNLSENEALGRPYNEISRWPCEAGNPCELDTVFAGDGTDRSLVKLDTFSTGMEQQHLHFERSFVPIMNSSQEVEFVIEVIRDITDQIKLQKEKQDRLKLEGIIEMAGTAAHRLNSPLFAALGTTELLRDDIEHPELRQELDTVLRNLRELSNITKEMTHITGFTSDSYVGDARLINMKTRTE